MFRFPLQLSSETFLIIRRNERDMIKNAQGEHEVFPDYKHSLQENYCTWNTTFFFFKM